MQGGEAAAAWLDKLCPHCGQPLPFERIDWRRSAAYGRVFIEISNVYESEAVPTDALLEGLREFSGTAWDYGYLRGPLSISSSTRAF